MKAQITKVQTEISRYTKKEVYAVFFKGEDGKSYKTWLDPMNGNYKRWYGFMKVGNVLDGLNLKGNGNLIDADSFPRLVPADSHKPVSPDQRDKMMRAGEVKTKGQSQQKLFEMPQKSVRKFI